MIYSSAPISSNSFFHTFQNRASSSASLASLSSLSQSSAFREHWTPLELPEKEGILTRGSADHQSQHPYPPIIYWEGKGLLCLWTDLMSLRSCNYTKCCAWSLQESVLYVYNRTLEELLIFFFVNRTKDIIKFSALFWFILPHFYSLRIPEAENYVTHGLVGLGGM